MMDFGEFDFGVSSPNSLIICGRSELPLNSITVIFGGAAENRVIAEFARSEEYVERRFPLEGITGKRSVSFAFLPGSNFDFKYFRFTAD